MNIGFNLIETNLNVSLALIVLFVLCVGTLVFFAKNFQLGCLLLLLSSGGAFMLSYPLGWNYAPSVVMMFVSIIMLSFSLYATSKVTQGSGLL